ncbi:MFS transporter [Roseisolibacter sp. H3M3-2]|uniref:MFS transporter n=1 Tax=Roseisolibacter sp. H3M3-2 TaxID=3031323 RepID=UPI0023DCD17F|nr:MFS transporter [Roseisolibacter sp. H3M3-2]MDF1503387.1 MFS transporter [Roseisolibacter sp. H3M3-2]
MTTTRPAHDVPAKVRRRLIPFMFVLYVVSYLDRINVGFAALQMNEDLRFSPAVYGLGAGIFFLGYCLLEVPSNLILARVGARRWIARIMIVWGIVSAAMMFVRTPTSFYVLRFLLGAAEAGFFPGMILYLTYWFPAAERARAVALFMTSTAMAGVVGGPLSGALLTLDGAAGLAGWQWLFLVEGIPAVLLGLVVLRYLPDGPHEARWLDDGERAWLVARLEAERAATEARRRFTLGEALTDGRVLGLGLLYFCIIVGLYGIGFWLPQILSGLAGRGAVTLGLLSALPYVVAAVGMVLIARHSDRTGERRLHVALPALVGAVGLAASAAATSPLALVAAICVAALGIWGALGTFWTLPTAFLTGRAAAGAIALINAVGNLGGFVSPYLVGLVRGSSTGFVGALAMLAAFLAGASVLALLLAHRAAPPALAPLPAE